MEKIYHPQRYIFADFYFVYYNYGMKKLIVLSGKQYSGKDTVAKLLLEEFKSFKRIGIGDAIKIMYGKKNNLTYEEIEADKSKYRTGLIELGYWGRKQDPDFWLNEIINMKEDTIVPDLRLEHELDIFKANNAYMIRVEAALEARRTRGIITNENYLTEIALDNYTGWNYKIDNSSDLPALRTNLKPLVEDIKEYFASFN